MINPITNFLEGRKQKPLKEGKKDVLEIESEYSIPVWVANAAQRAKQLSLVSHPAKFSHPDARTTPIFIKSEFKADGLVRSGNVSTELADVVGNAAALDVYAFLSLVLEDGQTVLEHFEQSTPVLKQLLKVDDETFSNWRSGFLAVKSTDQSIKTDANIKQVYFPTPEGYTLLSVLYPSALITENKERLRKFKAYAEDFKPAREARKKKHYHAAGYADMPKLLIQKFGGTKPQNISKLNSNNGGQAWLLPCFPPEIGTHYTRLPKNDFFKSLPSRNENLQELLKALYRLFKIEDYTNKAIRQSRKKLMTQVFEWVLGFAMRIQEQPAGWSKAEGFDLPLTQRLWLDSAYQEQRDLSPNWQTEIAQQLSDWFIFTYNRLPKESTAKDIHLGDEEYRAFTQELLDFVAQHEEFIL
ncbi:MAG: type I-F CRISPR-associated protein Csy1 [Thiofilum sp.]|uniref:type I-F CRISPR-associated protein Csy1 n=1 Tax=Thiofilum sp. TaxID=2212733 RepID=UPI0025D71A22|nr:type I-F CRISPR-associated protein Csy1 [Thiofilum sp.]MBK8455475.1 type I-F CRISPR-associated protein Csy1 [Thiofilum sp.]